MKEIEGFEMSKLNLIEEELKFKNWEILDYGHNSSVPKCKESVSEKSLYSEIRAKYPNFPWKRPEVDTEIGLWEFGTRKKGEEVISERHQKDYKKEYETEEVVTETATAGSFTDISFDDI